MNMDLKETQTLPVIRGLRAEARARANPAT